MGGTPASSPQELPENPGADDLILLLEGASARGGVFAEPAVHGEVVRLREILELIVAGEPLYDFEDYQAWVAINRITSCLGAPGELEEKLSCENYRRYRWTTYQQQGSRMLHMRREWLSPQAHRQDAPVASPTDM